MYFLKYNLLVQNVDRIAGWKRYWKKSHKTKIYYLFPKCYTQTNNFSVQHKYLMDKCSKHIVHSNVTTWQNCILGYFSLANMPVYSFLTPQWGCPTEAQSIKHLSEMLYHVLCIPPILQQMPRCPHPTVSFRLWQCTFMFVWPLRGRHTKMLSTSPFRDTFLTPKR